ncbi:MAG TPA: XRE family transcriptional regulator [Candidatus Omnitrophota bacterium]|nr:XRE family transcriptional regulator [Candidatus Omnitrophota bacterium]
MKIGNRLRDLRKQHEITLYELSEKSGVALATLSRIENNKMNGTIDSHNRICKALNISLSDLYQGVEDKEKTVEPLSRTLRTEHFSHSGKAVYELMVSKVTDKKIMPLMIRMAPGGHTQTEENKPGIEKFIYVLKSRLTANIGKETYMLSPGDSIYFDASLPHNFKNTSKTELEAICIISPPEL